LSLNLGAIFFLDGTFVLNIAPKFADRPIVVMEQGATARVPLDAMNGTIDSMTKTVVFFSLQPEF
jgi:hypothetical protein